MASELISVIVPIYKVEEYLRRCVDSILNQTYQNLAIILVDDGSPDNCPAICDEYAAKDQRVHVIHQENRGLSAARNAGMDYIYQARPELLGAYIGFLDSDDWVHKQYFEALITAADRFHADLVVCETTWVNEGQFPEDLPLDTRKLKIRQLPILEALRSGDARKYAWGRLYHRDLIRDKYFDSSLPIEDMPFNINLLCSNPDLRCFSVDAKLHYYLQRRTSLLHTMDSLRYIQMATYYLSYIGNGDGELSDQIRLQEAIKWFLSTRYSASVLAAPDIYKRCDAGVKSSIKKILKTPIISFKRRIAYTVFAYIPILYRLFRIMEDPTMLKWEQAMKQKRKEQRS